MKIAITGASGFVGKHLAELLAGEKNAIYALSNESNERWNEGSFFTRFYPADITDESQVSSVFEECAPSQVYHLAAVSSLAGASQQERLAFDVNVWGTRNVFQASAALTPAPCVLNVSSSQVYEDVGATPINEGMPLNPISVYAATKAMAETWAHLYRDRVNVITARSFNHTGPGQSDSFVLSYLARRVAEIEAGVTDPVILVGNLNVERDFTDVRDVVRAYSLLMNKGEAGGIYNVSSGKYYRLSDLLDLLLSLSRCKIAIKTDESRRRSNEPQRIWGDHTKLSERTGWQPTIPIEQTMRDMLNYWRAVVADPSGECRKRYSAQ